MSRDIRYLKLKDFNTFILEDSGSTCETLKTILEPNLSLSVFCINDYVHRESVPSKTAVRVAHVKVQAPKGVVLLLLLTPSLFHQMPHRRYLLFSPSAVPQTLFNYLDNACANMADKSKDRNGAR